MLLRLAGIAPDDLIVHCRQWLAERRTGDVAWVLTHAVLARHLRFTDDDLDLLAELLAAAELDGSALALADTVDGDLLPRYGFVSRPVEAGTEPAAVGDATGPSTVQDGPGDDVEWAVLVAIGREPAARAVWRSWRLPGNGAARRPPHRVFVVETDPDVELAGVTGRLQRAAADAGEADPLIEVYPMHAGLPSYQRLGRACGDLLWARDPDPEIQLALVVDEADEPATDEPDTHEPAWTVGAVPGR